MTPATVDMSPAPCVLPALPTSRPARVMVPGPGGWLTFLCLNLLGYALLGRGWAHVGVSPIFVGERVLCWGVVSFFLSGQWLRILNVPAVGLLLLRQAGGTYRA